MTLKCQGFQKLLKSMNFKLSLVKKIKDGYGLRLTIDWQSGILAWVLGDRSSLTFKPLRRLIRGWQSFLYVTNGWKVYLYFINDCDHLILKTYMTIEV